MPVLLALALAAHAADPAPVGPGDVMPDRHWDVVALDLDVAIDPAARTVEGTATHTVRPLGRRVGHLRLDAVALDVHEVRVDGAVVEGWHADDDHLDIPMPSTGDEHVVAVTYAATPQTGLHFRGPPDDAYVEVWSQGQENDNRFWFPNWDYPNDTFAYTAAITAPADLVALSNGVRGERTEHDGLATTHYQLDGPLAAYLVAVAVGPYTVFEASGPVPLEYVASPGVSEADMTAALGQTPEILAWLGDTLDEPYPWPVLRQVFVQRFLYGAMENTSFIVHGDFLRAPTAEPSGTYMEEVVAHEIVHQWFGDRVTPYGWRDLWLSEGFASFYAAEWQRQRHGDSYFAVVVAGWHPQALTDDGALAPAVVTTEDLVDDAFLMYSRGGMVLHGLRTWLGQDVFDRAVAAYLDAHAGGLAETSDLQRAFEDASGMHLGWWFDTYVHGTRFPKAKTAWHWEDGVLTLEIEQTTEGGPLQAPLSVEIGTSSATRQIDTWLGAGVTRVVVDLPAAPAWVAVDPEGAALVALDEVQPPEAWVAQVRHSAHPYARLVAMGHLDEGRASPDAVQALDDVLDDDDLAAEFRAKAAEVLGAIATPEAVSELIAGLDDPHPGVRAACATALGKTANADATAERLAAASRDDGDPSVRASALEALVHQDAKGAVALARKRIGAPLGSGWPHETLAAAHVLASDGDATDLPRLLALTDAAQPMYVKLTGLRSLKDALDHVDVGPKRDAARDAVSRRLEEMLASEDLKVRQTAVSVLGAVGDEASAGALTAFASECEIVPLAEDARDAAMKVRQRAAEGDSARAEAPPPEGTDVQRLQERVQALEERLRRLEDWRY